MILPEVDVGRSARLRNVIIERGVRIPPGWWWARTRCWTRKRFRRTDRGICLITQPMIDAIAA